MDAEAVYNASDPIGFAKESTSLPEPILPRVANSDKAAVEECIARYGGLVWTLARRLSPSEADAEDAVQEIFIDLWRSAGRFDATLSAEPTFIAMIARRRLIDRQRRKGSSPASSPIEPESVADSSRPPERQIEISEEASLAKSCLLELSADQQRVLKLSIFDGLSQSNIAEVTGLPLGTVKAHARRGLIRLRELMSRRTSSLAQGGAK